MALDPCASLDEVRRSNTLCPTRPTPVLTCEHDWSRDELVEGDADGCALDLVVHRHPVKKLEPAGDCWCEEGASPNDDAAVGQGMLRYTRAHVRMQW